MSQWPKKDELKQTLKELEKEPGSQSLPENATPIDQTKYEICEQFVKYMLNHELNQTELAQQLDLDDAIVSKIVRYRIEEFTIDRLYTYLKSLDPELKLSLTKKKDGEAA